jgi:predicted aspartyl protease
VTKRATVVLSVIGVLALVVSGCGAARDARSSSTSRVHNRVVPLIVMREGHAARAYARVTIHGQHYMFAIDTGATKTALKTSVALKLGLRPRGPEVHLISVGCTAGAKRVRLSDWQLDGVGLPSIQVTTAPLAGVNLRVAGQPVVGLLGSDVLARFESVTFEFSRSRLVLGARPPVSGRSVPLDIWHDPTIPGSQAELVHVTLGRIPVTLAVDTGAPLTTIDGPSTRHQRFKPLGGPVSIRGAAGCKLTVRPVGIQHWKVGSIVMPSVYALSGNIAVNRRGVSVQGFLGADVLSVYGEATVEFAPQPRLVLADPLFHARR